MITKEEFRRTIEEMLTLAATRIPKDVFERLKKSLKIEKKPIAKKQLEAILENTKIAKKEKKPLCQDTGLPIFFLKINNFRKIGFNVREAIKESILKATESIPLRPNVVDPLTRENSGNNTGRGHPLVYTEIQSKEEFEIELMLKGAGSENWSRLYMLNPTDTEDEIIERAVQLIDKAEGQICPPSIVGIGIGGTSDKASFLAKKALLRPLDEENEDRNLRKMEEKITKSANELEIGPMGLGGKTTVLGTRIEKAGCHTASLPVAVNFQCWAARRAKASFSDGEFKIRVPK